MYMKDRAKLSFGNSAVLAGMIIPGPGTSGLPVPVRPIIRFVSAAPTRVPITCHCGAMGDIETCFRAIRDLRVSDLIGLSLKMSATGGADEGDRVSFGDKTISPLPCAATPSVTEIVGLLGARRDEFDLSAPVTMNSNLMFGAESRTIYGLTSS